MKIRCLVVDDEPLARSVLVDYIDRVAYLDRIGECADAIEAAEALRDHETDLMFLDIEMPELSGLEFLETMRNPPKVILTTAYSRYALKGYEHSVIDYLLKPISFERFMKAVNKVSIPRVGGVESPSTAEPRKAFLFVRSGRTEHRVRFDAIRCVESRRNNMILHLDDRELEIVATLSSMERKLSGGTFLRIHKSFIVAVDRIERVEGDIVHLEGMKVPVGKFYKKDLKDFLDAHRFENP